MNVVINLMESISFVLNVVPKVSNSKNTSKRSLEKNVINNGKQLNPKVIYGILVAA